MIMNLSSVVVVLNSPTPLATSMGPNSVATPIGSTAYTFSVDRSAGSPVRFSLIVVPVGSRNTVSIPVAPVSEIGSNVNDTALPTGYSMTVYVPSGFCTVLVTVVVVVD